MSWFRETRSSLTLKWLKLDGCTNLDKSIIVELILEAEKDTTNLAGILPQGTQPSCWPINASPLSGLLC